MDNPKLSLSKRTRTTPFTSRVKESGVKAFTIYNHMLLPTIFDSLEKDYMHLKKYVQVWDVACQRQVEIRGPDASRLIQMLTPRDLRKMTVGYCFYTPIVDETGGMLNDPVVLKLSEERYWVSIADSDLLLWIKGLAYSLRLEVNIDEPDVSPLAIQGPKAEELVSRVFGEEIRDIRYFNYGMFPFEGRDLVIARSGYSKQGGFEIYVDGSDIAGPLWDNLIERGQDLNVRAGCPNLIERIEGRLLSYGNDMSRDNTPHECNLGRFCHTQSAVGCVGRDALLRVAIEGPIRQIRSISIEGDQLPLCENDWFAFAGGKRIGKITSSAWSPDFKKNVAIGMIKLTHWDDGTRIEIETPEGMRFAKVHETTFFSQNMLIN